MSHYNYKTTYVGTKDESLRLELGASNAKESNHEHEDIISSQFLRSLMKSFSRPVSHTGVSLSYGVLPRKRGMLELIGQSVSCILCRGSILYFDETGLEKFSRHLQFEHGARHDFDFMLAACKMNESEKGALVSVFNKATATPGISREHNLADKSKLDQEKIAVVSDNKPPKSLFSSQKRRKINFKTFRKRKSSISNKNVGNNVIDIKNSKVTKVTCGKCGRKFKSRTKLFKHRALKHVSLSVKPRKGKLRKKVEPLKKPSYIAATTASKAVEALLKDSGLNHQTVKPEDPEQNRDKSNSVEAPGLSRVKDESSKEIKDEVKDRDPLEYLKLRKIPPQTGDAQDTEVTNKETPSAKNEKTPEKVTEKEVLVNTPKDTKDPDCVECSELAGSSSKLSRHQRYVHGLKQDTPNKPTRREKKRAIVVPQEVTTPTKPTEEESPTTPTSSAANIETPQRSCLKNSSSKPRRLSVSFNRRVFFSDQTSLDHSESGSDLEELQEIQSSPLLKRSSQETEDITVLEPPNKKRKQETSPPVETLPEIVTESQPPEKNIKPKNANVDPLVMKTKPEAPVIQPLVKKSKPETPVIQPLVRKAIPEAPVSQPPPTQPPQAPQPAPKLFIQRQCENCPEIFSTPEQLRSHTCVVPREKRRSLEKKNYVENTVKKDGRSCEEEIILDEAVIVRVEENVKTGFAVRPHSERITVTPTTTKSWIKVKNPSKVVSVKPTIVRLPIESFLETVLVEETGEIKQPSTEDRGAIHDLLKKYEKRAKKVDFTKSNFFRKNAELLGGKSSGGGFKERLEFLPSDWRVKTYHEYKRFYLSPELVVLKSGAAVLEYLRLGYDLSHDNLRTLADCLDVSSRVFNRYLDELFDDCVVID